MGATIYAILSKQVRLLRAFFQRNKARKNRLTKNEWNEFYKAFELNFRGSQQDVECKIRSRYRAILESKKESDPTSHYKLLDLGCGHGEMLGLAKDVGYDVLGVDQSTEAVNQCLRLGMNAIVGDLLSVSQKQNSLSQDVVTFIHVIEHCPADFVLLLFKEAFRILKPGGLFIIETPSVYSLWSGHRQFYLDPTHSHPVHPEYIKFLAGYCGFSHCETLSFGEVVHPSRANLSGLTCIKDENSSLGIELKKIEKWLYGDMDISCVVKK